MCVTVSCANSAQGGIVQIRTYVHGLEVQLWNDEDALFVNRTSSE